MKTPNKSSNFALAAAALVAGLSLFGTATTQAAIITLTASDAAGASSFATAGNWSNLAAPSAGNDYFVTGNAVAQIKLRSPATGAAFTFGGDSLTFDGTATANFPGPPAGTGNAVLAIKNNLGVTQALTANWKFLGNAGTALSAVHVDGQSQGAAFTFGGTIDIATGATFRAQGSSGFTNTITASLSGAGLLKFDPTAGVDITKGTKYNLESDNNTAFTGTIQLTASAAIPVTLTLQGGTTNNYIGDSAKLVLSATQFANSVNLNFVGEDVLTSITYGGLLHTTPGTYGAIGSGATFTDAVFTGTGLLAIVPEPNTVAMGMIAVIGLMIFHRRKTRSVRS